MKQLLTEWRKFLKEGFQETDDYHTMGKSSSEYHPAWDYPPNENPSLMSMEAYEEAFVKAQDLAKKLGMGSISLTFIEGTSVENHLARYINGTSRSPVIVLTDKVEDEFEATLTLFHELGHAYVDGSGEGLENEEEVVEEFAQVAFGQGSEKAIAYLNGVLGKQANK
jgi:hypothetical protein